MGKYKIFYGILIFLYLLLVFISLGLVGRFYDIMPAGIKLILKLDSNFYKSGQGFIKIIIIIFFKKRSKLNIIFIKAIIAMDVFCFILGFAMIIILFKPKVKLAKILMGVGIVLLFFRFVCVMVFLADTSGTGLDFMKRIYTHQGSFTQESIDCAVVIIHLLIIYFFKFFSCYYNNN